MAKIDYTSKFQDEIKRVIENNYFLSKDNIKEIEKGFNVTISDKKAFESNLEELTQATHKMLIESTQSSLKKIGSLNKTILQMNKNYLVFGGQYTLGDIENLVTYIKSLKYNISIEKAYIGYFRNIKKAYNLDLVDIKGIELLSQIKNLRDLRKSLTYLNKNGCKLSEAITIVTSPPAPKKDDQNKHAKDNKLNLSPFVNGEESMIAVFKETSDEDKKQILADFDKSIQALSKNLDKIPALVKVQILDELKNMGVLEKLTELEG